MVIMVTDQYAGKAVQVVTQIMVQFARETLTYLATDAVENVQVVTKMMAALAAVILTHMLSTVTEEEQVYQ